MTRIVRIDTPLQVTDVTELWLTFRYTID